MLDEKQTEKLKKAIDEMDEAIAELLSRKEPPKDADLMTWLEETKRLGDVAIDAIRRAKQTHLAVAMTVVESARDKLDEFEFADAVRRVRDLAQKYVASWPTCPLCDEGILPGDKLFDGTVNGGLAHYECMIRGTQGGANHIRRLDRCAGGTLDADPPGLTRRQAAIEAHKAWIETLS